MSKLKLAIGTYAVDALHGGDLDGVLATVKLAEDLGFTQMVITDHVIMGENTDHYPYGPFPAAPDFSWLEPVVMMSAIAAVTEKIRLSTGILIAPLRSTPLLAKQAATLDQLSKGRLDLGLGTGWQREEYDFSGYSYERRGKFLREQVAAMRELWSEAPAAYAGEQVKFSHAHSRPFPVQGRQLPLWFGLAPTPYNAKLIAAQGVGWLPMAVEPEELRAGIAVIHEAFDAIGRDRSELQVRAVINPVFDESGGNLDASMANAAEQVAAGATMLCLEPSAFAQSAEQIPAVLEQFAQLQSIELPA